jgi:hypothetical protein
MIGRSLYDRLGGAFAIAAVVDHFSNQLVFPQSRDDLRAELKGTASRRSS